MSNSLVSEREKRKQEDYAKNEYIQQGIKFCEQTKTNISFELLYTKKEDIGERDVYKVTVEREGRMSQTFEFTSSVMDSLNGVFDKNSCEVMCLPKWRKGYAPSRDEIVKVFRVEPTEYCFLACITSYDPGTFMDFCSDFGYSDDSIKALSIYQAVCEEFQKVRSLFGDVLEQLQEIN